MFVVIGLGLNNIIIPIMTPLITFIYLTFIPGFLILRVFRIHKLSNIETILCAVGLSILSLMFIGFFMTVFYPLLGISKPITLIYLVATISLYMLALCVLSYIRDRDYSDPDFININEHFNSGFLFLCILPFLAIFGSHALNFYNNNLISLVLFALIGLTPILVIFDKIPKKLYSFTVWIIAISLVYVSSLVSVYVWGWDIQNEFYLANLVIQFSYWNLSLQDAYNAMLSIVMLAPIYSIFTGINLDHVFKIIYPFLFSLVPLGLYKIFKMQTNSKIAFAAVFLLMSTNTVYIELLSVARQMVAELFLVLMLLLIFSKSSNKSLIILFILFGMGLIFSHYAITYFFIFTLLCVSILSNLHRRIINKKSNNLLNFQNRKNTGLNMIILGFLISFTYLWYTNIAGGSATAGILAVLQAIYMDFLQKIIQNINLLLVLALPVVLAFILKKEIIKESFKKVSSKGFDQPFSIQMNGSSKLLAIVSSTVVAGLIFLTGLLGTWIVFMIVYLNSIIIFFSFAGFLSSFMHHSKNKIQKEYFMFAIIAIIFLIVGILSPYFQATFNISRIHRLSSLFLAPFCVIGGLIVIKSILKTLNITKIENTGIFKLFSLFLLIFMLFNTGFVSVIFEQSIPMHLTTDADPRFDFHPRFDTLELLGVRWLTENKLDISIYADIYGVFAFMRYICPPTSNSSPLQFHGGYHGTRYIHSPVLTTHYTNVFPIPYYDHDRGSYIYLRRLNLNNVFLTGFASRTNRNRVYEDMSKIINPKNRIYDNGGSRIYYG
ncbi:MAG: DUF2206 domain-containing protein [Methanobacteriaceae archaeon]